ncbi:hypothetical protein KDL01_09455 [Actinospica durhamensis]|uniref:LamG-like jellyroll fold domain-containing protein n=1 Tax=Actinospica durhamensis TaxID=1508375 RepID=A0A941ELF4_9ACTN|nr:hypothetical protein [Actinospica durhamensis]MBR7833491.1 hypothetical protein [Actinospica durhamensis]
MAAALFALCLTGANTAQAASSIPSNAAKPSSKSSSSSAAAGPQAAREQALKQARSTGKPVAVSSATTAFSTLTAEPNGQLVLSDSVNPQRTEVGGTWKSLDATLVRNADGTYSPKVSTEHLAISGGGTSPLASMAAGTYGLSLTLPSSIPALPAPTVSGATATYANVLPGVSLTVTASTTGGFSEVFEVADAQAAANPALSTLTFGTKTTGGIVVAADKAGNLTARTPRGVALFTAPIPQMWDSATSSAESATPATDPHTGIHLDRRTGSPVTSSAAAPGAAAHTARLGVSAGHGTLTLTADKSLLTGKNTAWPVFIDPTWASTGGDVNNWTYTSSEYPTATHFDIATSSDYLHVGYVDPDYDTDGYESNDISYFQYNMGALSSLLSGATVNTVNFYTDDVWSDSCTSEPIDLYYTGAINSSTSASTAPAWGSQLEQLSFAYGGTGCAAAQDVTWNSPALTTLVQDQANNGISKSTTLTLALRADDETNPLTWRKFDQSTATISITFDQPPNTPTAADMSTSPATPCASATTDAVGLGPVTLYSYVSTKMGSQNPLQYQFILWSSRAGSGGSPIYSFGPSSTATTPNDSFASIQLPASDFTGTSSWTAGSLTEFFWAVKVSDGLTSSLSFSPTCDFYYDPTKPGQPSFADTAQCGGGTIGTAGTSISFTLDPDTSNGEAKPSAYRYQLNTSAPATVPANGDGTGTITLIPVQRVNVLTVTEVSTGGNLGDTATCPFLVGPAANAADRDLTDDGIPDLLTAGQTEISNSNGTTPYTYTTDPSSAIPAGLDLSSGIPDSAGTAGTGEVQSNATDIGINGTGTGVNGSTPAGYNGDDVITGEFTGNGFQDVLAYNPSTTAGSIIQGNGNGLALSPQLTGYQAGIKVGDLADVNGDSPAQLVNAYDAASASNPVDETTPDLLGLSGNSTNGYYLEYYLTSGAGVFGAEGKGAAQLSNETPDGDTSWQNWVIASTQIADSPDLVLWKPSSGELCLWQDIQVTNLNINTGPLAVALGDSNYGTATLTYTGSATNPCGQELSSNFDTNTTMATLETADITGSGTPAVWTITPGATNNVNWTTFSNLSTTVGAVATATTGTTPQTLATTSHAWGLSDEQSGVATTAADASGGLTLTNNNGATTGNGANWSSGDYNTFNPDLDLTAADNGALTTSASSTSVINPNSSWTADIWAEPTTLGTAVWSQGGADNPLAVLSTTTAGAWELSVNTTAATSTTGNTFTVITGGTVDLSEWTEVTATYNADTNILSLYADGTEIAVVSDATVATVTTGPFILGAQQSSNTAYSAASLAHNYNGQLADLRIWNGVVPPTTAAALGSSFVPLTPGRIMDTRENGTTGNPRAGAALGPVTSDSTTVVPVEGATVAGTTLPSTNITAAAVSITVLSETANGYLTAYPDGSPTPITSTLNYLTSATGTNSAIVPLGTDGDFDIYNSSTGTAQLIVDVTGYFTTGTGANNTSTYTPLTDPSRALDTRSGLGTSEAPIASDAGITLTVAGNTTADIPADGTNTVTAVAINLTAINSTGSGELIAYPDATNSLTNPTESTALTYASGQNIAAALIVPVGANGKIDIYNSGGASVNVVGDISGYYTTSTTGQKFHALSSTRLLDTRAYNPSTGTKAPIPANTTITMPTPAAINATNPTLDLNITVTGGTAAGDLNVYPDGQSIPTASAINWATGQTAANLNIAAASNGNKIDIHNASSGTIEVIVDVDGYFVN